MRFRVEGTVFNGRLIDDTHGDFSFEVSADSPQEAGRKAREQIQQSAKSNRRIPDGDIKIWEIVCVHNIPPQDSLYLFVLGHMKNRWQKENALLTRYGYRQDALSTDNIPLSQAGGAPSILYIHPGTCTFSKRISSTFPNEMAVLIRLKARTSNEALYMINRAFEKLEAEEVTEIDGDHHSITYGQPMFSALYINTDRAFADVCDNRLQAGAI